MRYASHGKRHVRQDGEDGDGGEGCESRGVGYRYVEDRFVPALASRSRSHPTALHDLSMSGPGLELRACLLSFGFTSLGGGQSCAVRIR